jgi:hypothetical protein
VGQSKGCAKEKIVAISAYVKIKQTHLK